LRKAAKRAVDALWDEIGRLVDTVTADGCRNYFSATGYVHD
ncbi:MAG: IS630 family transposase, partial [Burkholderiaceae bacterium]|nr:IS630 family transposase [Burkholderiaceae bacterium]MDR2853298.1 IS630 family transposase [Burkholderiaceae bacterium]